MTSLHVIVPVVVIAGFLWRIFGGLDPTVRFFDDFFYYLKPAQNWVDGSGSTFFPGEATNGYHPIWFLWIAFLYAIAGHGTIFFGLVDFSVMVLIVGFFFLFEGFLRRVATRDLYATIGASVTTLAIAPKAMFGLEMAVTVFAAALLLNFLSRKPLPEQTIGDAAMAGLLGAFLILSRLDAVMLAPGLLVAVYPRWGWKRVIATALGAWPVYAYSAFNLVVYGHIGTTSATAKSLGFYWPPNWHFISVELPVRQVVEIGLMLLPVGAIVLLRMTTRSDARQIAMALAAAPLLQFAAQALLSGWRLYPWYVYYSFMVLGMTVALLLGEVERIRISARAALTAGMATVVAAAAWFGVAIKPDSGQADIAEWAQKVRLFSLDHPGVYAIGDAAGTPTWIMDRPTVHLEGLMMSQAFIDRIRQRQPLDEVFRAYHVNYYVAVRPTPLLADGNGCFHYVEPSPRQASVRAPAMAMTICSQPVAVFAVPDHYTVRIYSIDPATGIAR